MKYWASTEKYLSFSKSGVASSLKPFDKIFKRHLVRTAHLPAWTLFDLNRLRYNLIQLERFLGGIQHNCSHIDCQKSKF